MHWVIYDTNYFFPREYAYVPCSQVYMYVCYKRKYCLSVSCMNQGLGIVLMLRWITPCLGMKVWVKPFRPTYAWLHNQMDNPLSGYERTSETIQAYMCMTYSCNDVSEHLWKSLMELFMLLIQTSDPFTDVQRLLSDNRADSNLWTSVRELPLEHTEPWSCGCWIQTDDSITDVQWLLSHDLVDSITERFVRKSHLGHA